MFSSPTRLRRDPNLASPSGVIGRFGHNGPWGAGALLAYAVLLVSLWLYLDAYHHYPMVPRQPSMHDGWWNWTDQGRYYRESLAWAGGDLRPSQHWYLPLYSLLGALFVPFNRAEPFLVPDTMCFGLSGVLLCALAPRLAPELPFARFWGALAFFAADLTFHVSNISAQFAIKSWVEPWTTTPTAPLLLGLLLAALALRERPSAGLAALCGGLWGLILMTRPTEATWSSLPAILFCAVAVVRAKLPVAARVRAATAGIGAALLLAGVTVWLHWIVWGWSWGDYFLQSLGTGFELRLLPLRWSWLVLDARPAHERFQGLAVVFPWVLPGFAGILAAILARRSDRPVHLLVGGAIVVHWCVYLCYRDLHPEGLWRFSNYHYFKWTQGLLCFYALLLVLALGRALLRRTDRAAVAGAIGIVLLCCCWHVRMVDVPGRADAVTVRGPHELLVRGGLTRPDLAVLVPASGGEDAIYGGPDGIDEGGRSFGYNGDLKAWPLPGGFALSALRPLPTGDALIHLTPDVNVPADAHPRLVRMTLVFGLPCAIQPHRAVCRPSL